MGVPGSQHAAVARDLGERGVWYRVRLGPVYGKPEADKMLAALKARRGLKGYIVKEK